jgi:hypothetical protein
VSRLEPAASNWRTVPFGSWNLDFLWYLDVTVLGAFPFDIQRSTFPSYFLFGFCPPRPFRPFYRFFRASSYHPIACAVKKYFSLFRPLDSLCPPPCLNGGIFLMMKNRIVNAAVKLGIINGPSRPLLVLSVPCVPYNPFHQTDSMHISTPVKRFKNTAHPLASQPPTQFRTRLNTIYSPPTGDETGTHPSGCINSFKSVAYDDISFSKHKKARKKHTAWSRQLRTPNSALRISLWRLLDLFPNCTTLANLAK